MVTKRSLNTSWITFFGAILGTIFGLMETFGSLMAQVECIGGKLERKFLALQKIRKVVRERKRIFGFFNIIPKKRIKFTNRKVVGFTDI